MATDPDGPPPAKQKIAVIGGGVGAMVTAFELTEQPGWSDKYEITVYQLGWRLGGKGASGRNADKGQRIEEHGLHFWFGYYENAFNLIQRVYAALGRRPDQPLATWRDAFKPHSLFILMQFYKAEWSEWRLSPPSMPGVPGDGTIPPFWKLVDRLLEALHVHVASNVSASSAPATAPASGGMFSWLKRLFQRTEDKVVEEAEHVGLSAVRASIQRVAADPLHPDRHGWLNDALKDFEKYVEWVGSLIQNEVEDVPILRRLFSLVELGYYMLKGIIADDVAEKGFDQLDGLDLRQWLASHGASELALDSDSLRVSYESIFAFSEGSYAKPNLAAGVGLRGLLRLCFTYKEAFAWKMQAGMGDTIFGPFYEVLKARGVNFQFFSPVREILPSTDGTRIEKLIIGRQATIKGGGEYQPLVDVKALPCWPSKPLYDQLDQGAEIAKLAYGLESYWTEWKDVATDTLEFGKHFDLVVLGTSLAPISIIGRQLLQQKPQWQAMLNNVEAIGTQAFQIWTTEGDSTLRLARDGQELEVEGVQPIYGGFAQPHNTVADMTHLLPREDWPDGGGPRAIYYFCGPMALPHKIPTTKAIFYPLYEDVATNVRAAEWMRSNIQFLLPGTMFTGYPESFPDTLDFAQLYNPNRGPHDPPSANFDAQYWRANIDPSELYVLSTAGSIQYRMKPGETGYSNMVIAGDWTWNGLNYGCVEAATMSGMMASRAICGAPTIIFGENYPKA